MTERVLSVPPALFLGGLALSVTCGDSSPKGSGSGEIIHFVLLSGSLPPCQGLSLWESCQCRSALTERAQDICLREPSQSRLTPCQLPRRGSFLRSGGKQSKTSPFRGRWHRAAMTERVLPAARLFPQETSAQMLFSSTTPPVKMQCRAVRRPPGIALL